MVFVWWCFCGGVFVMAFLWRCSWWCFSGIFFLWCYFVVIFLCWCFCGGVFVVIFLRWCFCGGVFVVIFLWCFFFCGGLAKKKLLVFFMNFCFLLHNDNSFVCLLGVVVEFLFKSVDAK